MQVDFIAQKTQGLISDCKLLDIRNTEIRKVSLLENELPVIMITFTAQEILLFRNKKGEIALGREDAIQTSNYVFAFTKAQW